MKILVLMFVFLYVGCTSDPYVVHTLIDKDKNVKVERVCTHKTAYIPWYAVYVAGVVSYNYGQECQLKETPLPIISTGVSGPSVPVKQFSPLEQFNKSWLGKTPENEKGQVNAE